MYILSGVVEMARTLLDLDDDACADAASELGTSTKVATVNAALRYFAQRHRQKTVVDDLLDVDLDVGESIDRQAWRQ